MRINQLTLLSRSINIIRFYLFFSSSDTEFLVFTMAGVNSDTNFTSKETNPKKEKPAWFTEDVKEIPSNARNLLEKYSHIAPDQVLPHVVEQVRSYDIFV